MRSRLNSVAKLPVVNVRDSGLRPRLRFDSQRDAKNQLQRRLPEIKFENPLLARNVAGSERVAPIFEIDLHRPLFGYILRMIGELWPPPDAVSAGRVLS
jgi:hypothetical protein